MNTKDLIRVELNRLATATASGSQTLRADLDNGRLEVEISAIDQLGCTFERFAFQADQLAHATLDQLRSIAEALSKRLTYLLESISPIEIDDEACVVQMRSQPPHHDDDGTRYYELVVARGELTLRRYARIAGQPREVISAHVTREVFERLGKDFSEAVI